MSIPIGLALWTAAGFAVQELLEVAETADERLIFGCTALSLALAGAACFAAANIGYEKFHWRVLNGAIAGTWNPKDASTRLPLSGELKIESRVVLEGDEVEHDVVDAVHESASFGRVELLSTRSGFRHPPRHEWTALSLRGCGWASTESEWITLPAGWTNAERSAVGFGLGAALAVTTGLVGANGALPLVVASGIALIGWVLVRTYASVQLRRTNDGLERRRVVGSFVLSGWKPMPIPDITDFRRYPRVEWRQGAVICLRVHGGPKGLRPVEALRATEWMRRALSERSSPGSSEDVTL